MDELKSYAHDIVTHAFDAVVGYERAHAGLFTDVIVAMTQKVQARVLAAVDAAIDAHPPTATVKAAVAAMPK